MRQPVACLVGRIGKTRRTVLLIVRKNQNASLIVLINLAVRMVVAGLAAAVMLGKFVIVVTTALIIFFANLTVRGRSAVIMVAVDLVVVAPVIKFVVPIAALIRVAIATEYARKV